MKPSKITGIILHSIVKITKVSFYSNKIRSFSTSAMIPRTKQFQVEGLSTTHGGTEMSTSECKFPPLQILYNDSDFVVVDKPHSLRMDGDDFDDSLQKRLIAQLGGSKDSYKWVHQLDFATSGVICVAKTRQAAAIASESFRQRETYKEYYAVVLGHVGMNNTSWGTINSEELAGIRGKYMSLHNSICESMRCKSGQELECELIGEGDVEVATEASKAKAKDASPVLSGNNGGNGDGWEIKVMSENLDRFWVLLEELVESEYKNKPNNELLFKDLYPIWKSTKAKLEGNKKLRKTFRKEIKKVVEVLNSEAGFQKYSMPEMIPSEKPIDQKADTNIGGGHDDNDQHLKNSNEGSEVSMCLTPKYSFIAQISDGDCESINEIAVKRLKICEINNASAAENERNLLSIQSTTEIAESKVKNGFSNSSGNDALKKFIVICPLAELANDFRCHYGSDTDIGRYSETSVEVLQYSHITDVTGASVPITKLRLIPRTGRRHQLRLHCLLMNHVILGDVTYAPYWPNNRSDEGVTTSNSESSVTLAEMSSRMMLHARRLMVPRSSNSSLRKSYFESLNANGKNNVDAEGNQTLLLFDVETQDPFTDVSSLINY